MNKRRVAIPRLEPMEDRVVPSQFGGHLVSSATAEFHKLNKGLSKAYHKIQHDFQTQGTTHPGHVHTHQSGNGFVNSLKSLFKF
jgi:hypothetical protein